MSRSRRKTPVYGYARAESEAADKRLWHQRWRAHERDRLRKLPEDFEHLTTQRREVSNTWAMAKDGCQWFGWKQQQRQAGEIIGRGRSEQEREKMRARYLAQLRRK